MSNALTKKSVLVLNRSWVPIGLMSPQKAICNMFEGSMIGLFINYSEEDLANENYDNVAELQPLEWEDWKKLPFDPNGLYIHTVSERFLVPSIVITKNFNDVPYASISARLSRKNIFIRDEFKCAYTGKQYPENELNIDHIIPRSKGGKSSWTNLVTCHKKINSKKADKTPQEAGLTLVTKPYRPSQFQLMLKKTVWNPRWRIFLKDFV